MVYYYELSDGRIIAYSARGTYKYESRRWVLTNPLNNGEFERARLIDEIEVNRLIHLDDKVKGDYSGSYYLSSIRVRNNQLQGLDGESYLYNIPVIRQLLCGDELDITTPVTFFVGENGTGKSTLLEAIAVGFGFNAEGGSKNFSFESRKTHSDLFKLIALSKGSRPKDGFFLRAESFYNLASNIDDLENEEAGMLASYGGKSLHQQSHGESFMSLIRNRLFGEGLYLFDEPEAALSPMRMIEMMKEMRRLEQQNSQFIIVTHSPILVTYPGARIFEFTKAGFKEKLYHELDSFRFMRDYLNNPEYILSQFFEDL